MKKWCVVGLCCLLSLFLFEKKEELEPVFDDIQPNAYINEIVDVSNTSLTTLTITSLLDSLFLHSAVVEVPKLYQKKLGQTKKFTSQNISNQRLLSNIEKNIMNELKELGGQKEAEKISFYGVKLDSIEVYGRAHEIEILKRKLKDY